MYCWSSSGDGVNFSLLNVSFYALYISLEYYSTLVALSPRTLLVVLCLHRKNHQKKNITVYVHQKGLKCRGSANTFIHNNQFIRLFFLSNIEKKSCDLVTKKKPRKGNHLSFLASFCDKKILSLQYEFLNMTGVYSLHLWKCEMHFIVPKPEFTLNKSEFNLIIK